MGGPFNMSVEAQKETRGFETEVKQLLKIVIHSLYSNKEIFLRELISNASDASDKLRFEALKDNALYENDTELKVIVEVDKDKKQIRIIDNGIGMTREETTENLGTIAKSGTKAFLEKLTGDQAKDSKLIGQFGVGFYSGFIVADAITVETRRAGMKADQGVRWHSTGEGNYEIEYINKKQRGTTITLHVKPTEEEFLEPWRLRSITHKYSDHIPLPVLMAKNQTEEEIKEKKPVEYEAVNKATALWTLPKGQIKDEEYKELYKHITHAFDEPLLWSHNKVEGKLEYITLLFLPSSAPFDLWNRDKPHGLKLYVQRVYIMDNAEVFLPAYLRFIKGIVDSNDLPLNISREILQSNKVVDAIRTSIIKRSLTMLEELSTDKEKYGKFWGQFGQVLKEGPAEDFANREQIAKLLRFSSTHLDTQEQSASFAEYVGRMKAGQNKIYYMTAENFNAAKHSPHLEIFRKKGIEVLLLSDRVDEWLVAHLHEFEGKSLQSVAKGDLDLGDVENEKEKEEKKEVEKNFSDFIKQVKESLGSKVEDVHITYRLTDSPACIVVKDNELGGYMQRMLKAAGQPVPEAKPILELNPHHPIVISLKDEADTERFNEISHMLLEQSILAEGGHLDDPAQFIRRVNKLLLELSV